MRHFLLISWLMLSFAYSEEVTLIDLATLPRPPELEIRYATSFNFTGHQLYPFPAAFLRKEMAAAIEQIQAELAQEGLGLKIWDAYRPISVQQKMWDLIQDDRYVSDPKKNAGRHTRGTTVDVTLVDKLGRELEMPTDFDDFSEAAFSDAKTTEVAAKNRARLQAVMTKFGFEVYPYEWWHFDFHDWKNYPPMDVSVDQLK